MKSADIKPGMVVAYKRRSYMSAERVTVVQVTPYRKAKLYSDPTSGVQIDRGNGIRKDARLKWVPPRAIVMPWDEYEKAQKLDQEAQAEAERLRQEQQAYKESAVERFKRMLDRAEIPSNTIWTPFLGAAISIGIKEVDHLCQYIESLEKRPRA